MCRKVSPQLQCFPTDGERSPRQHCKASDQEQHTDEAHFFGDHRKDEIRVRLRKVVQLLHASTQTNAGGLSSSDRDQRLRQLES